MGLLGRFVRILMVATVLFASVLFVGTGAADAQVDSNQFANWGLTSRGTSRNVNSWAGLGWSVEKSGDDIFAGGNFLQVTNGPDVRNQSYLAKFESESTEFDPSFRPDVGGPVLALESSPDGALFVGGEMETWNNQNVGGLVKIDPSTGELWPGFDLRITGSWDTVRDIKIEPDGWAYAAGSFSRVVEDGRASTIRNIFRFDPLTGDVDTTWDPKVDGTVFGVSVSKTKDGIVYLSGKFLSVNGLGIDRTAGFVGVDSLGQVVVERPQDTLNNQGAESRGGTCDDINRFSTSYCYQMYDVEATANGNVWITGVEHSTFRLRESDYKVLNANFTYHSKRCQTIHENTPQLIDDDPECKRLGGGDGQELISDGNRVYASCHCFGVLYEGTDVSEITIPHVGNWGDIPLVDAGDHTKRVSGIILYDDRTGLADPSFDPYMSGNSGVWDMVIDGDCTWVTGGLTEVGEAGVEPVTEARHLVKLCDDGEQVDPQREPQPEPQPGPGQELSNCSVDVNNSDARVEWAGDPNSSYRIYRTVDGSRTYWRGRVDNARQFDDVLRADASHNYFVGEVLDDNSTSPLLACSPEGVRIQVEDDGTFGSCEIEKVGDSISVTWNGSPDADYRIHRSPDNGTYYWRGRVTGNQFEDSLREGPTFDYRVQQRTDGDWADTVDCGSVKR